MAEDGSIMGFRHRELPIHSVQFHPESVTTEHGHALLANFLKLAGVEFKARFKPHCGGHRFVSCEHLTRDAKWGER
jgi:hypothetical protein